MTGPAAASYLVMRCLTIYMVLSASLALAEVANLSGSWVLNEERSRFGNNPRPGLVTLTIEHNEPGLKYSGSVAPTDQGQMLEFEFDGAIDGKPYVTKEDRGDRTITFKRLNDRRIESISRWADGELRSIITISDDGRSLERRMFLRDNQGRRRRWTEIYEKKQ